MIVFILAFVAVLVAIPAGAVIAGADRIITARVQSRMGPPLLQPIYDVLKLFGKTPCITNFWLVFSSYMCLVVSATTLWLVFTGGDLLVIFFMTTISGVFRVVGALSVPSPFGQVGAQRDLLQMLAYEPLLIVAIVGLFVTTGSFKISQILATETPLLLELPLVYLALGYALTIKLCKSPFDIASSHHGHQEIVRGVLTDYSGPQLALLEIAHWLDVVLLLALCGLFWHTSIMGMALLLIVTYLAEIVVDNCTSRMTWPWMLKNALGPALALATLNILWLYA